ncbi:MAG: ABC transporter ATP-binding protein [Lewinellaceae bacterium]|nr:ABC transporter ATP-binding protein [Lewinellaceae bacterium]
MISIQNISKSFNKDSVTALRNINIEVERGELFGLIGPDGAGKTTLFRILATLLLADEGRAEIGGRDVVRDYKAIRRTIGYMPGRFALYQDLSIWENLQFYASVFGTTVAENYERIKPIYSQIEPFKDRRAGQLSGGMKQKLALSCALVHKPDILLLDEPTTGVDPVSRKEFWDILQLLRGQGLTIIVSTPYMDEARLCDRIALLQKGQILEQNTPDGIVSGHSEPLFSVRGPNMFALLQAVRLWPGTYSCFAFGDSHHAYLRPGAKPADLKDFLHQKGFENVAVEAIQPDIEDIFMHLLPA